MDRRQFMGASVIGLALPTIPFFVAKKDVTYVGDINDVALFNTALSAANIKDFNNDLLYEIELNCADGEVISLSFFNLEETFTSLRDLEIVSSKCSIYRYKSCLLDDGECLQVCYLNHFPNIKVNKEEFITINEYGPVFEGQGFSMSLVRYKGYRSSIG